MNYQQPVESEMYWHHVDMP
jgi:hypothetical protein